MYINAIGSYYRADKKFRVQQNFKGLIKDPSALPVIKNMSKGDKKEFKKIEKRLSKTKFWDMKISSIGNTFRDFKFEFIDKQKKHGVITDGIHPYNKKDNTISIYSIIFGPENISKNTLKTLRYKSSSRANAIYDNYIQNMEMVINKRFNLTPIESLKSKEIELNMLEEASCYDGIINKSNLVNTEISTKEHVGNDL